MSINLSLNRIVDQFDVLKNTQSYKKTKLLEAKGASIVQSLNKERANSEFGSESLRKRCAEFFKEVEDWKYGMEKGCRGSYYNRYLDKITPSKAWDILDRVSIQFNRTPNDTQSLLKILNEVKGMGNVRLNQTNDRASQKVASSFLRIMYPEHYGVVDWRVASVINNESGSKQKLKSKYNEIYANETSKFIDFYRQKGAEVGMRAADVEMTIFAISLEVWPEKAT
ncbi:TPA: hypothetical protein KD131_004744 [Vibrio parahaemolyticus]|nr:hypothetical protein [Vibrio parahaemolyticus]ELA9727706.1 hypothetical protein [Vibrio parahaemolyticus]HBC3612710.1 hypothetical protein [Vibrio parahaemolyticus]